MPQMQALLVSLPPWVQFGLAWVLVGCCVALGAASLTLNLRQRDRGVRLRERLDEATAQLEAQRSRDTLTGLATRAEFESNLQEAVWRFERKGGAPVSVLYVGLDDLRSINDGWGLQAGDAVLVQVAARLAQGPGGAAQLAPYVARVGGDEFALLLGAGEAAAVGIAAQICAAIAQPFEAEGRALGLTASVGVACYPEHGAWSRLPPHAAVAMRQVKQAGGNGHALFAPAMAVDAREQALLLQDLRLAVERGELRLLYQPKIDARSLQVTAAEALLRWEHPMRGVVPPAIFVPLAERHGLIGAIGDWVIGEACRQAADWRDRGLRMRIAINISGHQLRHDRFVANLEAQAWQHRIPPTRLTCEITESVAMEDTAQSRAAFERLRRAGFHVSIDDFGTGHSSLGVLRRLPAAELKVDRCFVVDLEVSESARSIVEAVLSVARTLGLRVVAEGVETEGQRDILVRMGCDELQGYLFAKPMSAAALALWAEGGAPAEGDSGASGGTPAFRPSLFHATNGEPMNP